MAVVEGDGREIDTSATEKGGDPVDRVLLVVGRPAFAREGRCSQGADHHGALLSSTIVGANYVDTPSLIIAFLTLAFFCNGLASITWSLVSAMAPQRLLGLTGGVFNFVGNLSGITVPIIIGYLARGFAAGLTYVATLALLGALSYMFVVGRMERLPDVG